MMTNRVKIIDYFEAVMDEVDLKAENLLAKYGPFDHENINNKYSSFEKLINQRRASFIDTIKGLKSHNLDRLSKHTREQQDNREDESIFDKYCFILDKYDLKFEHPLELTDADDEYFKHFVNELNETFGFLIVLEDGCLSQHQLELFKEIIYYGCEIDEYSADDIGPEQKHKFCVQIKKQPSGIESNIFDSKLDDVLNRVKVKFGWFENASNNYIIRTTAKELFKAKSVSFVDVGFLFTVKRDIINLFFSSPISISINNARKNRQNVDLDRFISSCKWFESNLSVQNIDLNLNNHNQVNLLDFSQIKTLQKIAICKAFNQSDFTNVNCHFVNLKSLEICLTEPPMNEIILESSFGKFFQLEELVLIIIGITNIDPGTFKGLYSLKKLDISCNNLERIKCDYFKDLINLTELDISENPIRIIENGAFSNLQKLKTLKIFNSPLDSIDDCLFDRLTSSLETLEIESPTSSIAHLARLEKLTNLKYCANNEASIDVELLVNLVNLKALHIYANKCVSIGSFNGMSNLRHLQINNFSPSNIAFESNTFEGLKKLTYCKIQYSNIDTIAAGTFDDLGNLKNLDLSQNQLLSIEPNLFDKLVSLQKIELFSNQICQIKSHTFACLTNLTYLDLSYNYIEKLHDNAFSGLTNLRFLDISENKLTTLKQNMFADVINLVELKMHSNQISTIEPGTFMSLNKLTTLNLSSNQLTSLDEYKFNGLLNLRRLILSTNKIAHIHSKAFDELINLKRLSLKFNPIQNFDRSMFKILDKLTNLQLG